MREKIILVMLLSAGAASAADTSSAFTEGKQFGTQQLTNNQGTVSTNNAQKNVPGYGTSSSISQYYQSGQGALTGPGNVKISDCATGQKAANGYAQQECDAVNFLAKNANQRQQYTIDKNKDPLLTNASQIISKANTDTSNTSTCQNITTTTPAQYEKQVCIQSRVVNNGTCNKTLSVSVSMSCSPGSTFPVLDLPRNDVDHVYIYAKCDMNAISNTYIEFTADAFGMQGGQNRNQTVQIPKDISTIPASSWVYSGAGVKGVQIAVTKPHWIGSIQTVPVYILPDSTGCKPNSTQCSYHFYWEWGYTSGGRWCMHGECFTDPLVYHFQGSNSGWATSVMGEITYTDSWQDGCANVQ